MANGQSFSGAQGTSAPSIAVALVGMALALSAGTLVSAQALTGLEIASASGTLVPPNTIALSGLSSTGAAGILAPSWVHDLVGSASPTESGFLMAMLRQPVELSQGTATVVHDHSLFGQTITAGQGLTTTNTDGVVPLLGMAGSAQAGSIVPTVPRDATGLQATADIGSVGVASQPPALPGLAIAGFHGTIGPQGSPITLVLSGLAAAFAQGGIRYTQGLTGQSVTVLHGIARADYVRTPSGQEMAALIGIIGGNLIPTDTFIQSEHAVVATGISIGLTGSVSALNAGAIGATRDTFQPLIGHVSMSAPGSMISDHANPLTGAGLTSAQYPFGAPGFGSLSGQLLAANQGSFFVTPDRTSPLIGVSSAINGGTASATDRVVMTGQPLTGGIGQLNPVGGTMARTLNGHILTVSTGSFGVIGQNQTLPTPSLEGCGIVVERSAEGCGIVQAVSCEAATLNSSAGEA